MILIDTHVFIWIVINSDRIGPDARLELDRASRSDSIGISAITPWEIALLVSKGRLDLGQAVEPWFDDAVVRSRMAIIPLRSSIAIQSVILPNYGGRDPADRIIIATARHEGLKLVTADRAILAYGAAGYLDTTPAYQ